MNLFSKLQLSEDEVLKLPLIGYVFRNSIRSINEIPNIHSYFTRTKRRASRHKIPLNVTKEYINDLYIKQGGKCAYSRLPLCFNRNSVTASLDRIDSSKGYVENNLQWVHKDINMMKQGLTHEVFLDLIKKIAANHI